MGATLSSKDWWNENQAKYTNSKSLDDLEPTFQANVKKFISMLKTAGAGVSVAATRRSAERAYLMHYSWCIANEEVEASDVPPKPGVNIMWDHGNRESSISGAREMVSLFGIRYKPSLTLNHIKGKAIDMNITWSGELTVTLTNGSTKTISGPSNGADNTELHAVGYEFDVRKLVKDPPHWSTDGR